MSIEIISTAISSAYSGDKEFVNPGIVKLIVYRENDVENSVTLPDPDMNNFIPINQVTNDTLIEWVMASK